MGANPYCYFAPFETDAENAVHRLRLREFNAGRYDPALQAADPPTYTFQQSFPPDENFPSPGAQHPSIEAALEDASESGTGSILDIFAVSDEPAFAHVTPVGSDEVQGLFGTPRPTRADFESLILKRSAMKHMSQDQRRTLMMFWDSIGRGEARVLTVYVESTPTELFFAGMSVD